jgi:hypothetical protein
MLHNYFKTYEVEEPETNAVKILGAGSYLLAGLLGSLYVLLQGFAGRFALALAVDIACGAVAAFIAIAVTGYLEDADAVIALLVVMILMLIVRSVPIIVIVKNGYRARGWLITRI